LDFYYFLLSLWVIIIVLKPDPAWRFDPRPGLAVRPETRLGGSTRDPAWRFDPRPGRPGPGTEPGLSKNQLGIWPGETRSTRNPVDLGKLSYSTYFFIYIYTPTHVKRCCFCCFFLLPLKSRLW
jgi:hypothetical protein